MTPLNFYWLLFVGLILWPSAASTQPTSSQGNQRLTVVISDLHMGVGQDAVTKKWHAMEDFRWQEEFALFLKHADTMRKGKTDLILNGDTFELWQSIKDDCPSAQKEVGCTEDQALTRMQTVLAAHQPDLEALGKFADSGENQVVVVPGNHDAALLFGKVEQAVLTAVPSNTGRVRIAKEGFWRSADGKLYAEHGHQIGRKADKENWSWPHPILTQNGLMHLQRSKEERTLQVYVNKYEMDIPAVDNTPEQEDALRIILASEHEAGAANANSDVFGALLFKTIWTNLAGTLGDQSSQSPTWDVTQIKKDGDKFFIESFQTDDPARASAVAAFQPGHQGPSVNDLDEDEISTICDQRAALVKLQQQEKSAGKRESISITECPRKGAALGAAANYFLRSRDKMFTAHLELTFKRLSDAKLANPGFDVFIYGATHVADGTGFRPRKKDWNPLVMNSGTWQRVAMKKDLDRMRAQPERKSLSDEGFLRSIKLDELSACYSAVLVEPYTDKPEPKLRYWTKGEVGAWRLNEKCQ